MTRNKKGQVTLYLGFLVLAIVLITFVAIGAPLGIRFTTEAFRASEKIIDETNSSISMIQDESVKGEIGQIISVGKTTTADHVELLGAFFQYGWVVVLISCVLVVFLSTRRLVDYGGGIV